MNKNNTIRLALPKGRIEAGVSSLLQEAGINLRGGSRAYRPTISLDGYEVKILKPQNIVEMLDIGSRDIGFAGADWVKELEANVVELLDTGLDPVRLVAAAQPEILENGELPKRTLVVTSEYSHLTKEWIKEKTLDATFLRSYGATEVFPPEDADCIVDNTATGATLRANGLEIIEELMTSSTRLFAHPRSLDIPEKRDQIERFVMVLRSVVEARTRVMIEVNVSAESLGALIKTIPCMREHTISSLHGDAGYAIKAAVPRKDLPSLIPEIKANGGTDIIVNKIAQIVP